MVPASIPDCCFSGPDNTPLRPESLSYTGTAMLARLRLPLAFDAHGVFPSRALEQW